MLPIQFFAPVPPEALEEPGPKKGKGNKKNTNAKDHSSDKDKSHFESSVEKSPMHNEEDGP